MVDNAYKIKAFINIRIECLQRLFRFSNVTITVMIYFFGSTTFKIGH